MSGPYSDFDLNPKGNEPEGEDPQGKAPHGANPQGGAPQGVGPQGYGPNGIAFTGDDAQAAEKTKSKLLWVVIALFLALIVVAAIIFGMILPKSNWFGSSDDVAFAQSSSEGNESAVAKGTVTKKATTKKTVTSTETTKAQAVGGRCAPRQFNEMMDHRVAYPEIDVIYCDGQWAYVARPQSDYFLIGRWDGHKWAPYVHHSSFSSGIPCYDKEKMTRDGVPAAMQARMDYTCDWEETSVSSSSRQSSSSSSTSSSTSTTETTYSSETSEPTTETGTTEMDEPAAGEVDSSL